MEDVKIHYDQTVRNSTGHIIQFVYGGDNMDGCYIEPNGNIKAPFNIQRILDEYPETNDILDKNIVETEVNRLFERIEKCCCLMEAVRDGALLPLRELITSRLLKSTISERNLKKVMNTLYERYERGMIQPSEMVGLIAGQSLGERNTQLSITADSEVQVKIENNFSTPTIGSLIDSYMKEHSGHVTTTHITEDGRESHILPTTHLDIKVPGLNYKTQKVEWKKVTEMSRHPVNGRLVKITTKSGKTVVATLAHSFVTQNQEGNPETIRGDQLVKGMMVPIKK